MSDHIHLNQPPAGFCGCIALIEGDRLLRRKLLGLGLRMGQQVAVLHQRPNGVVVSSNGNRLAIGYGIASKVVLTPIKVASERRIEQSGL